MKSEYIFFSLLLSILVYSCHDHAHGDDHGHRHDESTAPGHAAEENQVFTHLSKAQMSSIGLMTGPLEKKQLTASIKANGFLKVPNQNKASASTIIGGIVTAIHVQAGTFIQKGQSIVTISNPSFITLQEEYLTIDESVALAQTEVSRQKELHQGQANALKNVQAAESELKKLLTRKSSLRQQLELIGIKAESLTADNIRSTINIVSPIKGAISEVNVNMGSYVDANASVAEIVDHGQLHLDLYVFEKDLAKLKVGQTIHFTLTNYPGKEYDAKIFGISNTFEPETKAIAVHAQVQGDKQGLIDGMSITALISLDQATVDALPIDAFVNYQGQDFVFIVSDRPAADTLDPVEANDVFFKKIPVRRGTTDIGYSEATFLEEIPDSAAIVLKGAFFLMAKMTNQGEAHEH
jgi:RND family efflux transporter MFP subunit